jgi:hypothetical protein
MCREIVLQAYGGADDRGPCKWQRRILEEWHALADRAGKAFLTRREGADHFVVASLSMWPAESCAVTFGTQGKLGHALRIGVDGGPHMSSWKTRPPAFAYASPAEYLTVPSVGSVTLRGWRPPHLTARPNLASLCTMACCHDNYHKTLILRKHLRKLCLDAMHESMGGTTRCALGIPGKHFAVSATDARYRAAALSLYANSSFCLMPSGDWPSREPAMVDAMSTGCLPVIFHPEQRRLWPKHVPDWDAMSVFIHFEAILNGSVDVFETLASLPPRLVQRKRDALYRLMPQLVYAETDRSEGESRDAFDILLTAASRHSRQWPQRIRRAPSVAAEGVLSSSNSSIRET